MVLSAAKKPAQQCVGLGRRGAWSAVSLVNFPPGCSAPRIADQEIRRVNLLDTGRHTSRHALPRKSSSADMRQRRLRQRQPEGHLHGAVQRDGGQGARDLG
jgi:hypothetical protein